MTPDPAVLKKPLSITVLGVGGAGCNAVNHLAAQAQPGIHFAVLNTDAAALAQSAVETKLVLGMKSTRGLGAGGDPECGQAAAEEDSPQIRALCEGADMVFVVAGLGGGTGTGAGPVVARLARESGALVLGVVMLPFDCEGPRRQRQAVLGLQALKGMADGVVSLSNQKALKLIDEKTGLREAFQLTNEFISEGVRGIWRVLSRPGLINVDFADLCAVIRGQHGESALATVEARGENRARELVERLFVHPLIDGGLALTEAAGVLVCIAGGPEMAMAELNYVMEQITRHCEHANIIMGAAVDDDLSDRMMVTLLASRGKSGEEANVIADPATPRCSKDEAGASHGVPELEIQMDMSGNSSRPASKFVAPPPVLTPEKREHLLNQQAASGARQRKNANRMRQGQLPLEIISRGRFGKSEPTIHHGQDLDVPTYIRRGVALN